MDICPGCKKKESICCTVQRYVHMIENGVFIKVYTHIVTCRRYDMCDSFLDSLFPSSAVGLMRLQVGASVAWLAQLCMCMILWLVCRSPATDAVGVRWEWTGSYRMCLTLISLWAQRQTWTFKRIIKGLSSCLHIFRMQMCELTQKQTSLEISVHTTPTAPHHADGVKRGAALRHTQSRILSAIFTTYWNTMNIWATSEKIQSVCYSR